MTGKLSYILTAVFAALLLVPGTVRGQVPIKEIGATSGIAARIIHAAMPSFLQTGLDVAAYRVEILETDRSYAVLFQDADFERPPGHRGGSPHRLEYEVELEKTSLKVLDAHFVR